MSGLTRLVGIVSTIGDNKMTRDEFAVRILAGDYFNNYAEYRTALARVGKKGPQYGWLYKHEPDMRDNGYSVFTDVRSPNGRWEYVDESLFTEFDKRMAKLSNPESLEARRLDDEGSRT